MGKIIVVVVVFYKQIPPPPPPVGKLQKRNLTAKVCFHHHIV